MKSKIAMALIINACVVSLTTASDIYKWTDPNTGKITTSPSLPTYPIKEKHVVGKLPDGNLVEVIFNYDAPESMVRTVLEPTIKRLAPVGRIKSNSG